MTRFFPALIPLLPAQPGIQDIDLVYPTRTIFGSFFFSCAFSNATLAYRLVAVLKSIAVDVDASAFLWRKKMNIATANRSDAANLPAS
ncbi:hypothetical protein [Burkholderia sp. WAC0059]|uniref:hypothetical protein n=1 Tax=Burkholderia sp. WAC0059 TaxID=2066022 RepID=UPI0011AF727E|nr:hypothetical protein [Burkholderia sp. WAC0059]